MAEACAAGGLRAIARADWAERPLQVAGFGESAYTCACMVERFGALRQCSLALKRRLEDGGQGRN